PIIFIGPIVGMGLGAAAVGMLGGARKLGVPGDAGAGYEQRVRDGAVLLVVIGDDIELRDAAESLRTTGPRSLQHFAPWCGVPAAVGIRPVLFRAGGLLRAGR